MEYCTLFIVVLMYVDISSKLKKLTNNNDVNKKKFTLLKDMVGKEIEIDLDDEGYFSFEDKRKGILKEYNNTWIVLEVVDKKKNNRELYYYRTSNINSINIIE